MFVMMILVTRWYRYQRLIKTTVRVVSSLSRVWIRRRRSSRLTLFCETATSLDLLPSLLHFCYWLYLSSRQALPSSPCHAMFIICQRLPCTACSMRGWNLSFPGDDFDVAKCCKVLRRFANNFEMLRNAEASLVLAAPCQPCALQSIPQTHHEGKSVWHLLKRMRHRFFPALCSVLLLCRSTAPTGQSVS